MLWWKNKTTKSRQDDPLEVALFVSNYILARLRELLQVRFEGYLKWNLVKAFNGTVLFAPDHILEVTFFLPGKIPPHLDSTDDAKEEDTGFGHHICRLEDMVVIATGEKALSFPELCDAIAEAHREGHVLARQSPEMLGLLRLVQITCSLDVAPDDKAPDIAEEIAASVVAALGSGTIVRGEPTQFYPFVEPDSDAGQQHDLDFEVRISEPLPEAEVVARLSTLFPGIKGPLTGYGEIINGLFEGRTCTDRRLIWAHITGRQF